MATMNFEDKTLERIYRSLKWARNNSLQMLEASQKKDLLRYVPEGDGQHSGVHVQDIQSIINHEYLHQGQLVVMFRSLEAVLPERFRLAFDL